MFTSKRSVNYPDDPEIVAIAIDSHLSDLKIPCLDLNDPTAVSEFILSHTGLKYL